MITAARVRIHREVTEVLGHIDDPGVDIMSIIKAYDLPVEFPESVKGN